MHTPIFVRFLIGFVVAAAGCLAGLATAPCALADNDAPPPAPAVVQDWSADEFQFKATLGYPYGSDPTVYLYVPAQATQVNALLLLQQNVVEQKISVHPAIRAMADAHGVAIAWARNGFNPQFTSNAVETHAWIQQAFGQWGQAIGYGELGDVPLITFGHSSTTGYAQRAAEAAPDRILAVVQTHGWVGVEYLGDYVGPYLTFQGQYMEQNQQTKTIIPTRNIGSLSGVRRRLDAGWMPISIVDEYGSGHYDYSEPIVEFIAAYMGKAVDARLNPDGSLKTIDPDSGSIANIPGAPTSPIVVKPYATATQTEKENWAWYFDQALAQQAAAVIDGNGPWNRTAQMIGYNEAAGTFKPFGNDGLARAPYRLVPGTNEIEFFPVLLDAVPAGFVEAGQPLGVSSDPTITMEYDNGPYIYLDADGKYRVKLNRGGTSGYLVGRNLGDENNRPTVQPTHFSLGGIGSAAVALTNPGDQNPGAIITLEDLSTDTVYVGYYIDHGPARIIGDRQLEILALPANTTGPVEVELVAYALSAQGVLGMSSTTFHVVVPEPASLSCWAAGLLFAWRRRNSH